MEKDNIKKIPRIWKYLPIPLLDYDLAASIYPNIYLTEKEYDDFKSNNPSIWVQSIVLHEEVHLREQERIGILKFGFLYLISKKFRLEQEIMAIKEQMKFLKQNGVTYDVERKARHFSGKEYMYLMNYSDSKKILSDLWKNI